MARLVKNTAVAVHEDDSAGRPLSVASSVGTVANVRALADSSNQRTTKNQFRPRVGKGGSTSYQLRQYAEVTLGGGSLRKAVKLPEGEDENEWLAVNSRCRAAAFACLCFGSPRCADQGACLSG